MTSGKTNAYIFFFFFQAEDGIRDGHVTEFRRVLFRSAFGQTTGSSSPASIGIFAVAANRQRLAIEEGKQGWVAATAQTLLKCSPKYSRAYTVDTAGHRPFRGNGTRSQAGCAPITPIACPGHRPVMQSSPKHRGDEHPRLQLHVFLLNL